MGTRNLRPLSTGISRRGLITATATAAAVGTVLGAGPGGAVAGPALARDFEEHGLRPESRLITARDINNHTRPLVISVPGEYLLAEDVDWQTSDPNGRAITIAADNVTLDLGGATLRQIDPPAPIPNPDKGKPGAFQGEIVSGNVAIFAEGRQGVTIKNGSVQNVQGVGILVKDCRNVDLLRLEARNCGNDGVVNTSFLYRNGGIFVMGTNTGSTQAPNVTFASDLRMINCICSGNTSRLDYVVTLGALVLFTDNVLVRGCVFSSTANSSPKPTGVQFNVVGVDIVICRNVLVENCEANYNTSAGEPAGFFAWGKNYKFLHCRASGNYTVTGNRACGFNISTSDNLEMIDCEAEGNYNANTRDDAALGSDFSATGFRIGKAICRALIQDCRAIGNYSTVANAPASGFMLNAASSVVLKGCVALGNRNASGASSGPGLASGFHAAPTHPASASEPPIPSFGNVFIDCVADGNTVGQTPLFVQVPAPAADTPMVAGDPRMCAGFYLAQQQQPKLIGCQSLNNNGKGVWLTGCAGVVVERTLLASNAVLGLENEAAADAGVFVGNAARLNGPSHVTNFIGLPPGTPVQSWTIGVPPPAEAAGSLVNTSISRS
ncbi:MAG: right-handed parallel beta-helix repeat-containing protein [Rhodospirillaceae bacterium]